MEIHQETTVDTNSPLDAFWGVVNHDPANPNLKGASLAGLKAIGRGALYFARTLFSGNPDTPDVGARQ